MPDRSHGKRSIPADAFRRWFSGQRAAAEVIAEERRRWLTRLDRETALRLYLELVSLPGSDRRETAPSPVLAAMRQATSRKSHDVG